MYSSRYDPELDSSFRQLERQLVFLKRAEALFQAKSATKLAQLYESDASRLVPWDTKNGLYLWDWFIPLAPCEERERVGAIGDGGKWMCDVSRYETECSRPCIVYSFGVRTDSTFESELHDRTPCEIFGFDPAVDDMAGNAKGTPRIHFWKTALGAVGNGVDVISLEDAMRRYGHSFIDVLKIDIEYAEWDVLPPLLGRYTGGGNNHAQQQLPFEQLLIEIHHDHRQTPAFFAFMRAAREAGLVPYSNEVNCGPPSFGRPPEVIEISFYNTHAWFNRTRWAARHGVCI